MLTAIAAKGFYGINAVFRPILEYPLPPPVDCEEEKRRDPC